MPRPAARPGDDLPEVPGEGAGAALRLGRGPGRRPAAVPRRRADRGAAGPALGAGHQVGAAAAGDRDARRGGPPAPGVAPGPGDLVLRRDQPVADEAELASRGRPGSAQEQTKVANRAEDLAWEDYINRVNRAYREVQDDNIALAEDLLHGCPIERRGWEWHYVNRLCHPERLSRGGARRERDRDRLQPRRPPDRHRLGRPVLCRPGRPECRAVGPRDRPTAARPSRHGAP